MTADTEDSPVTTDSTDDIFENDGDGGMDGLSNFFRWLSVLENSRGNA
ncbi:hypothetical protein Vi05172_g11624 [Venturia inaequalis]|nr:hypothetical protein Vi05172_g11624 [Venturia inaequalis]